MDNSFTQFEKESRIFIEEYSGFQYHENLSGSPELSGRVVLLDVAGELIDTYSIRIVCSPNYPLSFPLVYETGGRVPVNIDWHMFGDGHACICSIPEEIIECNKGITLISFFKKHVIPYFFNQKHREMHGYFLNERSHGIKGNIEYFQEVFKTNDLGQIASLLLYILYNNEPNRVQYCFCGSNNKYRYCHKNAFRIFKQLPELVLKTFVKMIKINTI